MFYANKKHAQQYDNSARVKPNVEIPSESSIDSNNFIILL